jgi:hypoxanthine phosphoribosyltransferase
MKTISLLSVATIETKIDTVAQAIARHFVTLKTTELVAVVVMDGAMFFAADLLRAVYDFFPSYDPHEQVPVRIIPITCKSYGDGQSSGELTIHTQLKPDDFIGKRVLLIDDVLDTGKTLRVLSERIAALEALSIDIVVACEKNKKHEIEATWRLHSIPDVFIYGYGLDLKGVERNCPGVRQVIQ